MNCAAELKRRNIEDFRWTLRQKVDDVCRHFAASLDKRLTATLPATHGAMEVVLQQRHQQTAVIHVNVAVREGTAKYFSDIEGALLKDLLNSTTTESLSHAMARDIWLSSSSYMLLNSNRNRECSV